MLAVVLILGLTPFATGATTDKDAGPFSRAFHMTPAVIGKTLASPAHWKGSDFLKLSAVVGAGFLLGFADEGIRNSVMERRTLGEKHFFEHVTHFGDGIILGGFMAGFFAVGQFSGNDGLRKTAWLGVESYLAASVFSTALKLAIGRDRPGADKGNRSFHPFSTRSSQTSMPSGHATAVWSVATVIADRAENGFVDAACYGVAVLASLSRIYVDKHWASDILIGSAIGYFTAKKICALNRDPGGPKLSASFGPAGRGQAITLSLTF